MERVKQMALLEVRNVKKVYTTRFGGNQVEALRNVNFSVEPGEYVAVMGESGSGKSTLLNILAALDRPTKGKVYLKGRDLSGIKEKEMAAFRRQNLGFIFQDFHLLDTFSLRDNIFLPLVLSGMKYGKMEERLQPVAKQLEITQLLDKYPYEVSGGQKQRAAVARRWLPNHSFFSRTNRQERWTLGLPKHCLISLPVSMRTDRRSSWLHIVCVRQAQRKECFSSRMERCFISYIVEI